MYVKVCRFVKFGEKVDALRRHSNFKFDHIDSALVLEPFHILCVPQTLYKLICPWEVVNSVVQSVVELFCESINT